MTALTTVLAEAAHADTSGTWVFGAVTLGIFLVLGLISFSYRDVANRHSRKAEAYAKAHGGHDGAH